MGVKEKNMAKGNSPAKGAGTNSSSKVISIAADTDKVQPTKAEQLIYDLPRTMAFPSSKTIVKNVPDLQKLDDALKSAPIGTTVAFSIAYGGYANTKHEKWVYEKTSDTSWKSTILREDGTVRPNGSYRGIKALQSISDKKWSSYGDEGLTKAENNLLRKKR